MPLKKTITGDNDTNYRKANNRVDKVQAKSSR